MLEAALQHLPLVAILRGVQPEEVEGIADALYAEGFRVIEVPLNSPNALDSIARVARRMPADAVVGAGTVLSVQAVADVQAAGGKVIVMPHADVEVIRAAKAVSGAKASLSSTALTASMPTRPNPSTTASVTAMGQLTVTGETPSTNAAATSSAALAVNTRQNSDIPPDRAQALKRERSSADTASPWRSRR